MSNFGNYVLRLFLVGISYFLSARLGLLLAPPELAISLIWIPAGVATTALIRWGFNMWPAIFIAAASVMEYSFKQPWPFASITVIGQTLGPCAVAYLLKQLEFNSQFKYKHDIFIFTLATFTGLLIPTTTGIGALLFADKISNQGLMDAWLSWWVGDSIGVLVTTPLFLTLTKKNLKKLSEKGKELYIGTIITTSLMFLLFFQSSNTSIKLLPLVAIPLFFTVWAALRLDVLGTSFSVFALAFIASSGTAFDLGPFSLLASQQGAYLLWSYCASATIFSLMVTTIEIDRKAVSLLLHTQGADLQLSNEKLQQSVARSEKLAKEAIQENAKKSQFLAAVIHELRTPMNGVLGASQLFLTTKLSKEQEEVAEILKSSGDALMQLVEGVLDYSKIEAGQLRLVSGVFNLKELLQKTKQILSPQVQSKGLKLETEIAWHTPTQLIGDGSKLQQILLNLTSNAIKYTEKGGVKIIVKSLSQTDESVCIEFSIQDTGIGMDRDQTCRLFQPFAQIHPPSTHRDGSGLGLVITKQLVELMGGNISAKSEVGTGSTFSFNIHFNVIPNQTELTQIPQTEGASHSSKKLKVLLVEDDEINRKIGKMQLEHLGFFVDTVSNGTTALDRFQKGYTYNIVLVDCKLEGIDGHETARRLRAYEVSHSKKATPILAFTAHSTPYERDKCLKAGMNDLIPKPINLHDLSLTLKQWTEA